MLNVCFQNVVHRAHDEVHNRRRRVIDAAALAHLRVVGLQIILIEIDERIALEQAMFFLVSRAHLAAYRFALPERQILMDRRQVQALDDGQHLLDHPAHLAVFVLLKLGQEVDQFTD